MLETTTDQKDWMEIAFLWELES